MTTGVIAALAYPENTTRLDIANCSSFNKLVIALQQLLYLWKAPTRLTGHNITTSSLHFAYPFDNGDRRRIAAGSAESVAKNNCGQLITNPNF
jgi:hypothetical protein